jgi:hypothetical protein
MRAKAAFAKQFHGREVCMTDESHRRAKATGERAGFAVASDTILPAGSKSSGLHLIRNLGYPKQLLDHSLLRLFESISEMSVFCRFFIA